MALNPVVTKDANGVYWVTFTKDPSVELYYVKTPTGVTRSFDPKLPIKLGKNLVEPFTIEVTPADVVKRASELANFPEAPDPEPTPGLGTKLPEFLPASPGSTILVSTWSALQNAMATAPLGSIIKMTNDIDGSGDLIWRRVGDDAHVTRLVGSGFKLNGVRVEIMGAYFSVEDLEVIGGNPDCFKLDYSTSSSLRGSHHINIVRCTARNAAHQGLLISGESASAVHDVYVRDFRSINNGSNDNKDHGIYWSKGGVNCWLVNYYAENNQAYGLQMYPDCILKASGITIKGGRVRGGIVIGSESAGPTHDCIVVGADISGSPSSAIQNYHAGPNNQFRSCTEYNNRSGFDTGNLIYSNVGHSSDWKISDEDLGYMATHDIDGKPRSGIIKAGAYA